MSAQAVGDLAGVESCRSSFSPSSRFYANRLRRLRHDAMSSRVSHQLQVKESNTQAL